MSFNAEKEFAERNIERFRNTSLLKKIMKIAMDSLPGNVGLLLYDDLMTHKGETVFTVDGDECMLKDLFTSDSAQ